MGGTLDNMDFAILTIFHYEDRLLWEKQIYKCLMKHRERLPINEVSMQSVDRRVNDLHNDDYLESVIASRDPAAKEMVVAYIMTEKGEQLF